jgi:glycosyltransferase involved in cell wall biosynthesis
MKVLFLNASEVEGGAARAAVRLLHGVRSEGVDAQLLVRVKASDDRHVIGPRTRVGKAMGYVRPALESMWVGMWSSSRGGMFSPALLPDRLAPQAAELAPDVIHLHWIAHGMLRVETLRRFRRPIVWTLHDSWPFTGGCHVPQRCTRYRDACGECPVLGSSRRTDLSRWLWSRKRKAWRDLDLTVVSPSRWLADCARASSLFRDKRIEVIPNGLDLGRYKRADRRFARDVLGLPQDKRLILFGGKSCTEDPNKGLQQLLAALRALRAEGRHADAELVVFGSSDSSAFPGLATKPHCLGWLHDDATLALLYAASDVFVAPSLQEALGYTVMEAMACGTPCVAFRQGGVPDLIDHGDNGYLARPYEPEDLANGIAWVLEGGDRWNALSSRAREKIEGGFDLAVVARRHAALYRDVSSRGEPAPA